MIASSWKWSIAIGIVSAAFYHTHARQKKIEILAVKIDQPKTRSIYLLDLAFGVLGDDRLFHGLQFGIECRDNADALRLGGKGTFKAKKTNKNQDRQKRPARDACLHRPVRQFRIRWRAIPDDRRARRLRRPQMIQDRPRYRPHDLFRWPSSLNCLSRLETANRWDIGFGV